jgi:Collagen triple helix repeat (20 copies)
MPPPMPKRFRPNTSTVIAMLALVFAMSGGAYAATKYLITSTKQISPSVLRSLRGASGKPGPVGPAGAAGVGSAGPAGAAGAAGAAGSPGAQGEKGAQGERGLRGEKGAKGTEGSPWTAGGTLPVGASETGTWVMGEIPGGAAPGTLGLTRLSASLSFSIPLAKPIGGPLCEEESPECPVHIFEGTTIPAGCSGTVVEESVTELKASSGNLCVWVNQNLSTVTAEQIRTNDVENPATVGVGTHGGVLRTPGGFGERAHAEGNWAVTG